MKNAVRVMLFPLLVCIVVFAIHMNYTSKYWNLQATNNDVSLLDIWIDPTGFYHDCGFKQDLIVRQDIVRKRESPGKPSPQTLERRMLNPHWNGEKWYLLA